MAKILLGSDVQVFISDIVPYRLALAQQLGGVPIQVNEMDLSGVVRAHGLSGVDLAVDTSGKTLARLSCIDALDKRGVLVCVGHGENISLDVSRDLIAPERAVLGSEYFAYHELPDSLEYLRLHREFLGQIITHRFPVESIRQAFEVFFGGETGKVVIEQ